MRVFLIALVVAHHAGQPYGPTGGEWPVSDPAESPLLGAFFALNAAFFMGFFFLISGYFLEAGHDRKGPAAFLKSRLIRLGLPLLLFAGLIFPATSHAMSGSQRDFFAFLIQDYFGSLMFDFGHLWFTAHLLLCALLYAAWRAVLPGGGERRAPAPPGHGAILAYTLALALTGAAIRSLWPQDVWVRLFWLIPAEPAHLPQYASLFVIGIVAARGKWFSALPARTALPWVLAGAFAFALAAGFQGGALPLPAGFDMNLAWGALEAFVCTGAILGLLVLFRRFCDRPSRWLARLEGNVYGTYLIHPFVVVGLQVALLGLALPALAKLAIVTAAGLALSFVLTALLRRVPAIRAVI